MKNKIPCQHCKERYVGCHAECVDYKAYRNERDYINDLRQITNEKFGDVEYRTRENMHNHQKRKFGRKRYR